MNEATTPRVHRSVLTVVMETAVLLTVAIVLGRMAYEAVKPPPPPPPLPKVGGMQWTSHANNNLAHLAAAVQRVFQGRARVVSRTSMGVGVSWTARRLPPATLRHARG